MVGVVEFYKTHGVRATLKEFNISYRVLKKICAEEGFVKSKEQIKETYKTTKIDKYGSLDKAYEVSAQHRKDTILERYHSMEMFDFVRDNNSKITNRKKYGKDYFLMKGE